jgi:integrase
MAIRFRPSRRAPWQVYWNNPHTGKRESRSFEHEADARRHDSLVKHRLKHEPETFEAEAPHEPHEPGQSLEAMIYAYFRAKQFAPRNLRQSLFHARSILADIGPIQVLDLSKDLLRLAVQRQRERGLKQNTINRRISILKAALNWAEDEGLITANPVQRFSCPRGADEVIPPPTPREIEAILAVSPERIMRMVVLGVSLGIRIGERELFAMRWSDFDLSRQVVRVRTAKSKAEGKYRDLHLVDTLLPTLHVWQEQDIAAGIEHVINYKGRPVTHLKRSWAKTLKDAGITRRIRPYDLRHAFATYALDAGADPKAVAEVMGHADMAMIHRHYQHVLGRQRKAVMAAAPVPDLGTYSGHILEPKWAHFEVSGENKKQ